MCGLSGIVAWDDRYHVARPVLEKMSARLAHRGPDGQGIWLNHDAQATPVHPQVGLAHRRLAVLDLDVRANQPFTDGRGRWIVFNGEIYNFRELRGELSQLTPAYLWHTQGDTEVLLHAYAAWEEQCVEHLNGMFAFAIWDEMANTLFLARDRMGQKPLYVACPFAKDQIVRNALNFAQVDRQPVVAFASELGALRELPWINTEVSPAALRAYLSLGYIPDQTIYRGVVKLQPSTWVKFAPDRVTTQQYFQPRGPTARLAMSDDEARQSTRRLVETAVRRQLVADVPLGCFLSGGRSGPPRATRLDLFHGV
jgi:asparagine synthase (glutamine-hydrolysing)